MKKTLLFLSFLMTISGVNAQDLLKASIGSIPKNTLITAKKDMRVLPGQVLVQVGALESGEICQIVFTGKFINNQDVRVIREKKEFSTISGRISYGQVLLLQATPADQVIIFCKKNDFTIGEFIKGIESSFSVTFPAEIDFP